MNLSDHKNLALYGGIDMHIYRTYRGLLSVKFLQMCNFEVVHILIFADRRHHAVYVARHL